jgi:hypothetical protein
MLGEGFDLPELKLAVLHSPHKSLAVTLQFIGRFARTNAPQTGQAKFLAIPSEIKHEAQSLYVVGAEWNEIVEAASRRRIEAEQEAREVLATFQRPSPSVGQATIESEEDIDLASLAPYFHVKVYDITGNVTFDGNFHPPVEGEPILLRQSEEHHALVCLTKDVASCRWASDERLVDVNHDLFILFFDDDTHLLFICSSRREIAIYDTIVASVVQGSYRRLAPEELNRVLRDVANPEFFSIGMRNRSAFGYGESYRMITGKKADRAIQKADGKFYNRGHCFGRGQDDGQTITIGFSSASKVWANKWGNLPALFDWCRKLSSKLVDSRSVSTNSGLDNLPLGQRAVSFPERIVAIDWNEEVYKRGSIFLDSQDNSDSSPQFLLDLSLSIAEVTPEQIVFCIEGDNLAVEVEYKLDRPSWFSIRRGNYACSDQEGAHESDLLAFLQEFPPSFFTADLSRLEGDTLYAGMPTPDEVFDTTVIEEIDWRSAGVNPLLEKPDGSSSVSIFDWIQRRLVADGSAVVFNDDGSGEVADFVTLTSTAAGATSVMLYHCKAAMQNPVPGNRVDDIYEVAGQAVKSVRFASPSLLRKHLLRRLHDNPNRLVKGTRADIERLLADGVILTAVVNIVQPGIGRALSAAQSALLASTNAYMIAGQVARLRVLGCCTS